MDIIEFLTSSDKNILMIKSRQTFFTAISVYQALLTGNQSDNFIFSDLKQFHKHKEEITKNFESVLVIEINEDIREDLSRVLKNFKKVVLISNSDGFDQLKKYFLNNSSIEKQGDALEYKYEDLTDDSKLKLIESMVRFQNKVVKFKDLLGINSIDELSDDLKSTIDLEIFFRLVEIGEDDDKNDSYIERTFYRCIKLDQKIFKEQSNDIMAIPDSPKLNKADLKCVKFNEKYSTNIPLDETKVIILSSNHNNSKDEFESLCKNSKFEGKNLHLLKYNDSGDLIWVKTLGHIELIKRCTLLEKKSRIKLEEKYFYDLNEINEQIIVLSDKAGMGKSMFMTNLRKYLTISSFVLKIDLNKYFTQLNNYQIKFQEKRSKRSIEFLNDLNILKTDLEKHLVLNILNYTIKLKLIVLFDGLDEISPYYKDAVLDIIDDLKQMNTKIIITTRPHLKEELENRYGVISYQMAKFSYENQKEFLKNYWRDNFKINNIEEKADEVLKKLRKLVNDRERKLTGIPIQLKLLSEIYLDEFDKDEELDLKLLYDKFVKKKFYDIHYKEKLNRNLFDPREKDEINEKFETFKEEHEKLAFLNLLIREKNQNIFQSLKKETKQLIKEYKTGAKNYGIISGIIGDNSIFIHKTFEEYFCASHLSKNLNKYKFVFEKILLETDNKIIRLFLNQNKLETNEEDFFGRLANKLFKRNKSHIMNVVREGLVKLLKYLIENGADVNAKDEHEWTALMCATENDHFEMVKFLLENGAKINAKNIYAETALILASKSCNLKTVKYLVQCGADVNAKDQHGYRGLLLAAIYGRYDIVKYLVDNGADVNAKSYYHETALILASAHNHPEIVKYLLDNGADVNVANSHKNTALILASEVGNIKMVTYLVEKGANVNATNNDNDSAFTLAEKKGHLEIKEFLANNGASPKAENNKLICATENGNYEIVKYLVENGADVNSKNNNNIPVLILASMFRRFEIVKYLVEKGADVNAKGLDGYTALLLASFYGNLETLQLIIEAGADVNAKDQDGNTALVIASKSGHLELVKYLVEKKADLNTRDNSYNTALIHAILKEKIEIVKCLVENGVDLNSNNEINQTALMLASEKGHLEIVKYLVENGADVNAKDNNNNTALMFASEKGHLEIVKLLVEYSENDVNLKNENNETPIIFACEKGHLEIVEYLVEKSADVNAKDECDNTALMLASERGYLEIVTNLVEHGADVNASDKWNDTPLIFASGNGHFEIVQYLVEKGADVNIKNEDNQSALTLADENGFNEIANYLREHGAVFNAIDEDNDELDPEERLFAS